MRLLISDVCHTRGTTRACISRARILSYTAFGFGRVEREAGLRC
jgi:hypothetical protein